MTVLTNRWLSCAAAALLALAFAGCTSNDQTPGPLKLEGSSYQFDGWGTSLAWWANAIGAGGDWKPDQSDQVLAALFGDPDHQSEAIAEQPIDPLGLNVVRYNIGASPPASATSELPGNCRSFRAGAAVPSTQEPGAPVDLSNDTRQIDVLRRAKALIDASNGAGESTHLEAFANSPPWWLVDDRCPAGTPHAAPFDAGGEAREAYAGYLVDVLSAFHHQGIDFATVDPFNEPTNGNWGDCRGNGGCQEGANFAPEAQGPVVDALCRHLESGEQARLPTRISANDAFGFDDIGQSLPRWQSNGCLGQVNVHGYGGGSRGDLRKAVGDKRSLWMSEYGTGPCKNEGDAAETCAGIVLSKQIADDLQYLRPQAWVYWQALEGRGGWGLLTDSQFPTPPAPGQLYPTPRFWALAQYTRYIRGGSTIWPVARSGAELKPDDDAPRVIVARTAAGRVVVVATNPADHDQQLSIFLEPVASGGTAAGSRVSLVAGRGPQFSTPAPIALKDATLTDQLPAQTITTYTIGARPGASPAGARIPTRDCPTPPIQGEGVSDVRATGVSCAYAVRFAARSRLCSLRTPTSSATCTDLGWRCAVGPGRVGGIDADCQRGGRRITWRSGF